MNPLIEYIDFCKKQGYSDELIMKKLISSGYSGDKIELAFMEYRNDQVKNFQGSVTDLNENSDDNSNFFEEESHKKHISNVKFLGLIVLVLLILAAVAGYFFFTI